MKEEIFNILKLYRKSWRHHLKKEFPEFFKERIKSSNELKMPLLENIYEYFEKRPSCQVCGKPVKFKNIFDGYSKYCGSNCSKKSEETKEKRKQTCLKKYGVENPSQDREIKKKKEQTCLKHFGCKYARQSEEFKNKFKETCLEKYGVDHPAKTKEILEKRRNTYLQRYGVTNFSQLQEFKNKFKETCLEKYGVDHPAKTKEFQDKIKHTCLEKYGDSKYNNREKAKQTCLKKYGVENPSQDREINQKAQKARWKRKPFRIEGKEFILQGYENLALEYLIYALKYDINQITNQKIPSFEYFYKSQRHFYHPDFQYKNLIIEVKSTHTLGIYPQNLSQFSIIKEKAKAVKLAGFNFKLIICDLKWGILDLTFEELEKLNFKEILNIIHQKESPHQ